MMQTWAKQPTYWAVARQLQLDYSFGTTPTVMASTIVTWVKEFELYKQAFPISAKGRWRRSFILAEEEYKLKTLE